MRYDVSVIGLYILDVLGRPVARIPERGNVDFIEEIRLTVAGTAGGTVVDTAKLGLRSLAVGAVGDDEKADWVLMTLEKHGIDVVRDAAAQGHTDIGDDPQCEAEWRAAGLACARRFRSFRRSGCDL